MNKISYELYLAVSTPFIILVATKREVEVTSKFVLTTGPLALEKFLPS